MSRKMQALVLDAMGVIYKNGDDVGELLIPFIKENNGTSDSLLIEALYLKASLGQISSKQFWLGVGLDSSLEDRYIENHKLMTGVKEFLSIIKSEFDVVACLSNDVSEWSHKLRKKFNLEKYIDHWFISGDIGYRKPTHAIYTKMLADLALPPSNVIFIDDRKKNVSASLELGIRGILLGECLPSNGIAACKDFQALIHSIL